ncbi:MAG: radical SAM protein [Bacteroidetes bacterium]|nr:radical SAM protein [Bacteroidota bacterium]
MATALFDKIIFGPIKSRRLGISLGINLLSPHSKLCNFDCIYCECGWTKNNEHSTEKPHFNDKKDVLISLENFLKERAEKKEPLDVITFAGNGEPTMHPDFEEIINKTIELRNEFFPNVKIAVLSNSTMLGKESVRRALAKVDRAILKIDSAFDKTIAQINEPIGQYSLQNILDNMALFTGEIIIQTMFLRGENKGETIDNTTEKEVSAWIKVLKQVKPTQVMIYSLDRDTPLKTIEKVGKGELNIIAEKVRNAGFECSVA